MILAIQAKGVDMTDAIKQYAEEKMSSLEKYFDNITQIDVTVGMRSNHHKQGKIFYTEANVHLPKKKIYMSKEAESLYKSIDKVRDHLKVEFEKVKGHMRHKERENIREQKAYQSE